MAKKKETKNNKSKKILCYVNEANVETLNIFDYCKQIMLLFGANVNISRSIPNGFDGLKPVELRTIYAMYYTLNARYGKLKKVQKISGEVIGRFHPHGDSSVVDVICAMGQWFSTPIVLIKKQGNYGTVTGEPHAAARYIEGCLSEFAEDVFFREWTPNIVEFKKAYTGEDKEPETLPTAIPLILVKDIYGISYGASSGIPYYPLDEVIDLTIKLIKNPKAKAVLIPDSPTGCPVVDTDWEKMCETGYGSFKFRGEAEIDRENNTIIITSIPHKTSTDAITSTLTALVNEKKIDGIQDIKDETKDRDCQEKTTIELKIILKKGYSPEQMLDTIYKVTDLQMSFSVKYDVVYNYSNYHVSLRSLILNWLENRRNTKRRIYSYQYSTILKRIHILEALLKILQSNGEDKLIKIGRKSKNRQTMIESLISTFKISDIQAEALSDMKFYNVSKDNISAYKKELKECKSEENKIKKILDSTEVVDNIIIDELKYFKDKYAIPRMSKIINPADINEIPKSKHIIAFTNQGYIKKLDIDYSGVGRLDDGDFIVDIFKAENTDDLLIFDENGMTYNLPVFEIDNTGKSRGIKINKLIKCKTNKIISLFVKPTLKELDSSDKLMYLVFATKNGIVKKSLVKHYTNAGASGIIGISLSDDKLVSVSLVKGDKQIILHTNKGMYIKFGTDEISETQRVTKGVSGMKLAKSQEVIGMEVLSKTKNYVVIITNKGNGKKCLLRSFDTTKRGVGGNTLIKLGNGEMIKVVISARNGNLLKIYTELGTEEIKVEDIPEMLKITAGKKLFSLGRSNSILKAILDK